jgi:uncharacterized protein involved in high-affinity Fe2+ transport
MKRGLPAAVLAALVIAGCGSATGLSVGTNTGSSMSTGTGTTAAAGMSASTSSGTSTSSSMSGMSMGTSTGTSSTASGATAVPEVNGIKPVASQVLATAYWQGMKIQARTMTPIPFYVYNGTSYQVHKPTKHTSFHLMIMLNDEHTNEPIPYAAVWATISQHGKTVYDSTQWPMISAYMGPHYGNNVTLPGPGRYKLTLLISPPVSARHIEYKNVWLKKHKVTVSFNWKPTS